MDTHDSDGDLDDRQEPSWKDMRDADGDLDSPLPQHVDRTHTPTRSDLYCPDIWIDAMWQLAYGQTNVSTKHTFVHIASTKQRLRRAQTAPGRIQTAPEIAAEHEAAAETAVAAEQQHPEWELQVVAREHETAEETAVAAEEKPPEHKGEHEAREVAAKQEPPKRSKGDMNFRKRMQKRQQAIKRSKEKLELPPMPPPQGVPAAHHESPSATASDSDRSCGNIVDNAIKELERNEELRRKVKMKLEEITRESNAIVAREQNEVIMIARRRLRRCCKHILRIPRMGEGVAKARSGPMECQDTAVTQQKWPCTMLRKGNGYVWKPERPGRRYERKLCRRLQRILSGASATTSDSDTPD